MLLFVMTSSTGESDSGPGASTPDEPVPGQTHDHPHRRDVPQRWTVTGRQHSPLPHPPKLLQRHPSSGGELSACTRACQIPCRTLTSSSHLFPQVEASASSLNTNDVFVLKTPGALFVWRGVGASDEEMDAAKHVVGFLGGSPSQVSEGKEPGGCPLKTNTLYVRQWEKGTGLSIQLQKEGASSLCVNIIFMNLMAVLYFCSVFKVLLEKNSNGLLANKNTWRDSSP